MVVISDRKPVLDTMFEQGERMGPPGEIRFAAKYLAQAEDLAVANYRGVTLGQASSTP